MDLILNAISEHYVASLAGACAVIVIAARMAASVASAIACERTRREVAAYIAEGGIPPEQGVRLLRTAMGGEPACP